MKGSDTMHEELTFTLAEWKASPFSKDPDAAYWVSKGSPVLWVEEYNKDGVKAYGDAAYGRLKLVVNDKLGISSVGHCLLYEDYVLLSDYYTGGGIQLFKRVR